MSDPKELTAQANGMANSANKDGLNSRLCDGSTISQDWKTTAGERDKPSFPHSDHATRQMGLVRGLKPAKTIEGQR